jgi:chromosome segregation ATPase
MKGAELAKSQEIGRIVSQVQWLTENTGTMATHFPGIQEELTTIKKDHQSILSHIQLIETQLKSIQDLLATIDARVQSLTDQQQTLQGQITNMQLEANEYKTILDNIEKTRLRDKASLQMRVRVLEQRDPDGTISSKIQNIETLLEQRKLVQETIEAQLAALEDPRDADQILQDVKERLAEGIAEAVADSREEIKQSIREIIREELDQQNPPPPPLLPPKPSCSPRRRSLRQSPYPPRQPTPLERRPLREFYQLHLYYPGWPLPEAPPQQPPYPRHSSSTLQPAPPIDP